MPKRFLYFVIVLEALALLAVTVLLLTARPGEDASQAESAVNLSGRAMTVYVKKVGTGERNSNVVGKLYLGDDASGDSEFLLDLVAGCFPTWTWDPRAGFNLLVAETADIDAESLDTLMRRGALTFQFRVNGELQIIKTMGIRAATLSFDDRRLRLGQRCT